MTEDQASTFLSEFQTACDTAHQYAGSFMDGLIVILGLFLFLNCMLTFFIAYKVSRR